MARVDEDSGRLAFPNTNLARPLQSAVSTSSSSPRDRMDTVDSDGCLITNVHRLSDQMAHWLNAQRFDSEEKKNVERLLKDLGIVPDFFDLNDITNLSWLDSSLHIYLDKYDLFAITAELETCEKLKKLLMDEYSHRQNEVDMGGPMRNRVYEHLTFPIKLQFVPLRSQQMSPHYFPLLRRNDDGSDTYRLYIPCIDGLFRETTDPADIISPPFSTFEQSTTRLQSEMLNVWLIMLNAEAKFSRYIAKYGLETIHPHMQPIAQATIEIVDLIYKPLDRRVKSSLLTRQSTRKRGTVDYADSDSDPSGSETKAETEAETETKTGSGPSGPGVFSRGDLVQVDGDGCSSLLALFHELSGPERKAMCQDFFFGGDMAAAAATGFEPGGRSTELQAHVEFFNPLADGDSEIIWPSDTYLSFRALKFGVVLSILAMLLIYSGVSYVAWGTFLPDPYFRLKIKNTHQAKHGSGSSSIGNFDEKRFDSMFKMYSSDGSHLSFKDGARMIYGNRNMFDFFGCFAAVFEWTASYILLSPSTQGMKKEDVKAIFDDLWKET